MNGSELGQDLEANRAIASEHRRIRDRRQADRRVQVRRGPERRNGWIGAENYDYEAEAKTRGRRKLGSEKRQTIERRVGEQRTSIRREGPKDRRQLDRRKQRRRYDDQNYTRSLSVEGALSVSSHGLKSAEERNRKPKPPVRRPEQVSAAIAVGPKASPNWARTIKKEVPQVPTKKLAEDNFKPMGDRIRDFGKSLWRGVSGKTEDTTQGGDAA